MNELLPIARNIFELVLLASGYTAVLAVLVLLALALAGRFLSPRCRYALWMLVIVRLMLPIAPTSACSAFNLFALMDWRGPLVRPAADASESVNVRIETFWSDENTPVAALRPSVPSTAREAQGISNDALWSTVQTLAVGGWLLIAMILAAHTLIVSLRFWRMIRSVPPSTDPRLRKILHSAADRLGVTRPVRLCVTPLVEQPAVMGIVRPRLLLPPDVAAAYGNDELEMIFLHELAHVKRRDIAMNWLLAALRAIHWFNPAVYLAARRMAAERELACDALVLAAVGHDRHRQYGYLLLHLVERMTDPRSKRRAMPVGMTGMVGFCERSRFMKERFAMLKVTSHRQGLVRRLLPYGLAIGLGLLGLTNATTNADSPAAANKSPTAKVADVVAPGADAPLTTPDQLAEHTEHNAVLDEHFPFGLNTRVQIGHEFASGQANDATGQHDAAASPDARSVSEPEEPHIIIVYEVGDLIDRIASQRNSTREKARETIEWLIASNVEPKWFEESKFLIVQTQTMHERIADLLEFFRTHALCTVSIDAHFIASPISGDELLDGIELADEQPNDKSQKVPSINCHVLSEEQAQQVFANLQADAATKVLSQPTISFLNGQTASICVFADRPFTFFGKQNGDELPPERVQLPVLHKWIQLGVKGQVTDEQNGKFQWEIERRDSGYGAHWATATELKPGQWVLMGPAPGFHADGQQDSLIVLAEVEILGLPLP